MVLGFNGSSDSHILHREPLRADKLNRQVIREEVGGSGDRFSLPFVDNTSSGGDPPTPSKTTKIVTDFGFDCPKLFSVPTKPASFPSNSENHISHTSLNEPNRQPLDPNSTASVLSFQEQDQAEANKEQNTKGKELQRNEDEARKKEQEAKQKEREATRKEQDAKEKEESRKKDEELKKREAELRKHEDELRKREEEVRKCEEEVRKRQEEMRSCVEDAKKRAEEARKKELEARQKNEALDDDIACAQLFTLLQAPEKLEKLVSLQEHQAQEMVDHLQRVRLAFIVPHHVHLTR